MFVPGPNPELGMSAVFHLMNHSHRAPENLLQQLVLTGRTLVVHAPAWAHSWSLAQLISLMSAFFFACLRFSPINV